MATGFSVVDFMDLPGGERRIVRLVLRRIVISKAQLREAIAALPASQQIDPAQLDAVLDHLTETHWLLKQVSDQQVLYRVNSIHRTTNQNQGFWDRFDRPGAFQIDLAASLSMKRGGKRKLPTAIWDRLGDSADKPARRDSGSR